MQALLDKAKQKTDWLQAKMLYLQDNTLSYADIAQLFGVSTRQVERRGADEDWSGCRQDVVENVESIITTKIIDERVEINEKHQKQYAAVQAYIRTYSPPKTKPAHPAILNGWQQNKHQ